MATPALIGCLGPKIDGLCGERASARRIMVMIAILSEILGVCLAEQGPYNWVILAMDTRRVMSLILAPWLLC